MKTPHERTPLLTQNNNGNPDIVIEVTPPPPSFSESETLSGQLASLNKYLTFKVKNSDRLFYKIPHSWFVRLSIPLLAFSAVSIFYTSCIGPEIIAFNGDDCQSFISDHNFTSNYYGYNWSPEYVYGQDFDRVAFALNNSGCLADVNQHCWLSVECYFNREGLIDDAYKITNPHECQLENVNLDLRLDLELYRMTGKREPCDWSCSAKTISNYVDNRSYARDVCTTVIREAASTKGILRLCKELAPYNSRLVDAETAQRNMIITTNALLSTLGVTLLFMVLNRYVLQSAYIGFQHKKTIDSLFKQVNELINTLDPADKDRTIIDAIALAEKSTRGKFQFAFFPGIARIPTASVAEFTKSIQSMIEIRNKILFLKYGKEILKILLLGSHPKNHVSEKQKNPFTLFSQVDSSGDLRNQIFRFVGFDESFYFKK